MKMNKGRDKQFIVVKYQLIEAKKLIKEIKEAGKIAAEPQKTKLANLLIRAHQFRADLIQEAKDRYKHFNWMKLC